MRVGVQRRSRFKSIVSASHPARFVSMFAAGHSVVVETSAGAGIGATDET